MSQKILLASATGNLGGQIAKALTARNAHARYPEMRCTSVADIAGTFLAAGGEK
jgi:hypothetical protein